MHLHIYIMHTYLLCKSNICFQVIRDPQERKHGATKG